VVFENGFPTIRDELESYAATPFVNFYLLVYLLHATIYLCAVEI